MTTKKIEPQSLTTEVDISYTERFDVQNAEIEKATSHEDVNQTFHIQAHTRNEENTQILFDKTYNLNDYSNINLSAPMSLSKLREFYNTYDCSTEKSYEYLKNYIIENKDNPEALDSAISVLLENLEDFYDEDKSHCGVANNQLGVFDKVLNAPEDSQINGMICGPIHEFAMNLLHDCGINAVIPIGKDGEGGQHCTLIYQRPDGKYVFNNYNNSIVLKASNIVDALTEISKNSGEFLFPGYIILEDGGKTSYQKFGYRNESVFGKEMDKGDYDSYSPFAHSVSENSIIKGSVEVSNQGNISTQVIGTLASGYDSRQQETSLALGYQNRGETEMFNFSQSVGIKAEHKRISFDTNRNKTFFEAKGIVSYIDGNTHDIKCSVANADEINIATVRMSEQINKDLNTVGLGNYQISPTLCNPLSTLKPSQKSQQNLSAFFRTTWGKEHSLFSNDKLELTNVGQLSGIMGGTLSLNDQGFGGDIRLAAEEGLQLTNRGTNFQVHNNIGAGLVGDLKIKHQGSFIGIQPGIKLNAGSSFEITPSKNITFGANAGAYAVVTKPAKDWGFNANTHAAYHPSSSDIKLFGSAGISLDRQQLTLGGFNERVEDRTTVSAIIGAEFNNRVSVNAGYRQEINPLNYTKNCTTFNLGAAIKF